jgi:curved DNA-binding protein
MTATQDDLYRILSVPPSASAEEIRRAYRILARRYHPDINTQNDAAERFAKIAFAYRTLGNPHLRRKYDQAKVIQRQDKTPNQKKATSSKTSNFSKHYTQTKVDPIKPLSLPTLLQFLLKTIVRLFFPSSNIKKTLKTNERQVAVIEVPLSINDAIFGTIKSVEIDENSKKKNIKVRVPPAVRTGSVVHLRAKNPPGDEIVMVVKVLPEPGITIEAQRIIIDLPITIKEALEGAVIAVPTFSTQTMLSIPPRSQSGELIPLRGKGGPLKNGERGDLWYRILITLPTTSEPINLINLIRDLESHYQESPRKSLPQCLLKKSN